MLDVHGVLLRVARVLRHLVRVRCAVPDRGITQYDLRTLSLWTTGNNSPEGRNGAELAGENTRSPNLRDREGWAMRIKKPRRPKPAGFVRLRLLRCLASSTTAGEQERQAKGGEDRRGGFGRCCTCGFG